MSELKLIRGSDILALCESLHGIKAIELQAAATILAQRKNQVVGEKNEYYITLRQLEALLQGPGEALG